MTNVIEFDKRLYSDLYHVILMLQETVVCPVPLKEILYYTKQKGKQHDRAYKYKDIQEHLVHMENQRLVRRTNDCYEVN